MKINWNDQVTLKLTSTGQDVYEAHHRELDAQVKMPRAADHDYRPATIKVELWQAAHIFGENLYNGCNPPFDLTCELHRVV